MKSPILDARSGRLVAIGEMVRYNSPILRTVRTPEGELDFEPTGEVDRSGWRPLKIRWGLFDAEVLIERHEPDQAARQWVRGPVWYFDPKAEGRWRVVVMPT